MQHDGQEEGDKGAHGKEPRWQPPGPIAGEAGKVKHEWLTVELHEQRPQYCNEPGPIVQQA